MKRLRSNNYEKVSHPPLLISKNLSILFSTLIVSAVAFGSPQFSETETDQQIELAAHALELARKNAEITSREDLQRHMQEARDSSSPLDALSSEGLRAFLSSLVFTSHGLASWRYDMLIEELSDQQIYEVLKLFGQQYRSFLVDEAMLSDDEREIRRALLPIYGMPMDSPHMERKRAGGDYVIQWDCPQGGCEICLDGHGGCVVAENITSTCDPSACSSLPPPPGGCDGLGGFPNC